MRMIQCVVLTMTLVALSSLSRAQSYKVIHFFGGPPDGANPRAGVIRDSSGNLYGTTSAGGNSNNTSCPGGTCGIAYKLSPTGVLSVLHNFVGGTADGAVPRGGLLRDSSGNLYGTTVVGGSGQCSSIAFGPGCGTVFEIDSSGNEMLLHSFTNTNADGDAPQTDLQQDSAGNFYGTTELGGIGYGVVFKVNSSHQVSSIFALGGGTDGGLPFGGVATDSSGHLYATASSDGQGGLGECVYFRGCGVVFEISSSGGLPTVVHSFAGESVDGAIPVAGVIRDSAGNLYGTTAYGGSNDLGVVFKVDSSGNESVLHYFGSQSPDGYDPEAPLVRDSAGNLYGTTRAGGAHGLGTVFKLSPGGQETLLHSFAGGTGDGAYPEAGLYLDTGGHLYGTTEQGGVSNSKCPNGGTCGVVFRITLPNFKITDSPTSVTLSPGQSGMTTLTITPVAKFSGTVKLTCKVPTGVGLTCSVSPNSVTIGGTTSAAATLSVNTSLATPASTYKTTATGTSGTLKHSVSFAVTVN